MEEKRRRSMNTSGHDPNPRRQLTPEEQKRRAAAREEAQRRAAARTAAQKRAREQAQEHFAQFGLQGFEYKYPAQLSGGMRQRAALLRTFLQGNKVALLDEPFSALDTLTRTSMQEWYLQVMEEIKLSTIFITHDIDEAILISDRIRIMKGSPAVLSEEIVISGEKPRNQDFLLTEEFLDYKRSIRQML